MLVVTRFTVAADEAEEFEQAARGAIALLAARPGYLGARLGRAADDPTLWLLATEWTGAGAWRRALSSYDVRVQAWPLLARAHDEPTAYEVIHSDLPAVRPDDGPR